MGVPYFNSNEGTDLEIPDNDRQLMDMAEKNDERKKLFNHKLEMAKLINKANKNVSLKINDLG